MPHGTPLPSPRRGFEAQRGAALGPPPFPSPDPGWVKGPGAPRSSGNPAPSRKQPSRAAGRVTVGRRRGL